MSQVGSHEQDGAGSEAAGRDCVGLCNVKTPNGKLFTGKTFESGLRFIRRKNLALQHRDTEKPKNDRMKK